MLQKHNVSTLTYDQHVKNRIRARMVQERAMQDSTWAELNKIDMSKFMKETNNNFTITQCLLNNIDCTNMWEFQQTYLGKNYGSVKNMDKS